MIILLLCGFNIQGSYFAIKNFWPNSSWARLRGTKIFLARRTYPIRHGHVSGVQKYFLPYPICHRYKSVKYFR